MVEGLGKALKRVYSYLAFVGGQVQTDEASPKRAFLKEEMVTLKSFTKHAPALKLCKTHE